jgi:glycosyltransferase involved in cell wall biosynthesis
VLPYLRCLAQQHGIESRLVTFERSAHQFPEGEFPRERWVGIDGRSGANLVAKTLDVVSGIWIVTRLARKDRTEVLHARSYLPAAIALIAGLFTGRPFIFDTRGFMGDEYVDADYWRPTDLRYRFVRLVEGALFRAAGEIVVLTEAAAERLRTDPDYEKHTRGKRVSVIPAAVDLERFRPGLTRPACPTVVYAGSLGSWYRLDEMLRVYAYARQLEPRLRFLILNQHEHGLVVDAIARIGLRDAPIEIRAADFSEVPKLLVTAHVGILLLRQSPSKAASSPIKVGEYLASGLPVVINAGMGDTDGLVSRYRAGYVVTSYSDEALREAGRALVELVRDEDSRANARTLAEAELGVGQAAARYGAIYQRLAERAADDAS